MSTPTASLDKNAPYVLALALGGLLLFVVAMSRTFGLSNLLRGPGQQGEGGAKPAKKLQIAGPYSLDEIKKHNEPDDAWIIVDGKVYDITSYVEDHPGGDIILKNVGGDASIGAHGPQHPASMWDVLGLYYIGDVKQ